MARHKNKKTSQMRSREPLAVTRANALRSALGFTIDRSFVESRRQPYISSPAPRTQPETEVYRVVSKPNQLAKTRQAPVYTPQNRMVHSIPAEAIICARRSIRKEIMHAFGHAGKSGQKKPVPRSTVKCKG